MAKGLDGKFLHYGIRKEDLDLINKGIEAVQKKGIDKQLLARCSEIDRKTLRVALGIHTHSLRYLKVMEKATHRLDLDGNAGDEVTPEHRSHASEILRERFKKDAERRKALREAEALEKQRAEKLSQLVEKFGKK